MEWGPFSPNEVGMMAQHVMRFICSDKKVVLNRCSHFANGLFLVCLPIKILNVILLSSILAKIYCIDERGWEERYTVSQMLVTATIGSRSIGH